MMKKVHQIAVSLVVVASFVLLPSIAVAANYGLDETAGKAGYETGAQNTVESSVGKVISTLLAILAIAFFVLVTYAGLRWMLARGNEEAVMEAKNTLEAAVIGLVVILSAYGITSFIFSRLDQGKVSTNTQLYGPEYTPCSQINDESDCNSRGYCAFINAACVTVDNALRGACVKIEDNLLKDCIITIKADCEAIGSSYVFYEDKDEAFCSQLAQNNPSPQVPTACAVANDADVRNSGASLECNGRYVGDTCAEQSSSDNQKHCNLLQGTQPYKFCKCE
jgi:hypothetical protein